MRRGGLAAMPDATPEILEPYRRYLGVLASVHLDPRLRGKLDPAALPGLRSAEGPAVTAWLRAILATELADVAEHYDRDKRDVDRERSIEAELDRSASGLGAWLAAEQSSPSQRACRNEDVLRLADALAELPDAMREAVVLKHCQGWTLQQIADRMNTTVPAVASLLRRGLEQLRTRLTGGHAMTTPADSHGSDPLDAVVADYLQQVEAGTPPDRDALLAAHPELADRLRAFFADLDGLGGAGEAFRLPDAALPEDFGDYEFVRELGRGGMGVV